MFCDKNARIKLFLLLTVAGRRRSLVTTRLVDWRNEMAADAADAADAAAAAAAVATGDKQPPPRNEQKEASLALTVENIVDLLDGERAKNVEVIEATRPNSLCRFIVVASPHNARHERALTLAIYKRFCKPHNLRVSKPKLQRSPARKSRCF